MKVQIAGFELGSARDWGEGDVARLFFYGFIPTGVGRKILSLSNDDVERVDTFHISFDTGEFALFNNDQEEPFHKGFVNLKIGD